MYAVHRFSFSSLITALAPFLPSVLSALTNETASKTVVFTIMGRKVTYNAPVYRVLHQRVKYTGC